MMGRMEKGILTGIAVVLVVLLLLLGYQSSMKETQARTYNISVLVRAPSERFRKGMDQAALDYNVDVHLLSSYEQDASAQQGAFLERELSNHADAIVMLPEDVDSMQAFLVNLDKHALIVTIGQRLQHDSVVGHIGVDDFALGEKLAQLVAERAPGLPCMIISTKPVTPNITARMQGFYKVMLERSIRCEVLYSEPDAIAGNMGGRETSAVVALDAAMLLPICENARAEDVIFGAGYASNIRTHLENGRISGLIVYSEYDEGYLSMRTAALAAIGEPIGNVELGLYIVDADTMYAPPLKQILFPIG